jgi:hypothetical protein
MAFDFGPGTDDDRHAKRAPRHGRLSVTVSTWMVAALAGAVAVASCSTLDSNPPKTGTGGRAAGGSTGAGGIAIGTGGSAMGGSGAGGSGTDGSAMGGSGAGGAAVDAGVDAPATDVPVPCGPANDCCPNDPNKNDPGMCGCGVADTDTDGDGVANCIDECPNDPAKFTAGMCGCGVPEANNGDTDGDGTPDCLDQCPKDKTRTKRGACGCGVADNAPLCLAHRYQFNDLPGNDGGATDGGGPDAGVPSGTIIHDSVGSADGIAVRCMPSGNGSITLTGPTNIATQDQYIQLPGGIISALGNSATFEAWINYTDGGAFWQRIFDFGGNDQIPGNKGAGNSFIFLTPRGGPAGVLFNSFITLGGQLTEAAATTPLPGGTIQHVAVVVNGTPADGGAPTLTLYVNGAPIMSSPLGTHLTELNDVNNWLGRSQFLLDPSFSGTYYEFRIYSAARTADQVKADFDTGMDNLPSN